MPVLHQVLGWEDGGVVVGRTIWSGLSHFPTPASAARISKPQALRVGGRGVLKENRDCCSKKGE